MKSIAELILKEWNQFQKVQNEGGRASCQNHMKEFVMNRLAQFLTWSDEMRESYYQDLDEIRNLWHLGREVTPEMDVQKMSSLICGWKRAVSCSFGLGKDI